MIRAADACALAAAMCDMAARAPEQRLCYRVCLSGMTAIPQLATADVPMLTGHGQADDLARLLHTFHQWGEPIQVGLTLTCGLLQFWLEGED